MTKGVNMDPIQILLDDHARILARLAPLRIAVHQIAERGRAALPDVLPVVRDVVPAVAVHLAAHSRREDEAFFPVVEAACGGHFGPTDVMRGEHEAMDETIERLQAMLADAEPHWGVNDLGDWCGRLIHLIDAHFGKEESVVFPMARQALTEDALRQIGEALDAARLS